MAGHPELPPLHQPRSDSPFAVELGGIAHRFPRRWVLRGVSLRLAHGEAVAITGANGSGKSTLLRIIATLLRPTRGGGSVHGFDLARDAGIVRPFIGMLGHTNGVYADLSAEENLRFTLRMLGRPADSATVARALAEVGLAREASERVRTFSAGMQRRLALARLTLQAPLLLLLDEPYGSFDAEGIERVNEMIQAGCARGGAALVVTHDPARAERVVDRIVRLEEGRIRAVDEAELPGVAEGASDQDEPTWAGGGV
jgi:heme ABC exporter ATP-binding subunit CcmA